MKRLHVHVAVENLYDAVKFYSTMFGAQPVKLKTDYAKWLLEDPRVNFAISARGRKPGLDHLGVQVDEETELAEVRERVKSADMKTYDEGVTSCCYAKADKSWLIDPAGIAWEAYRTMGDVEMYGRDQSLPTTAEEGACCGPAPKSEKDAACCGPSATKEKASLGENVSASKKCC